MWLLSTPASSAQFSKRRQSCHLPGQLGVQGRNAAAVEGAKADLHAAVTVAPVWVVIQLLSHQCDLAHPAEGLDKAGEFELASDGLAVARKRPTGQLGQRGLDFIAVQ